jgi:hypothetical protein
MLSFIFGGFSHRSFAQHERSGRVPVVTADTIRNYDNRKKNLLEQVLNYTASGEERGGIVPRFSTVPGESAGYYAEFGQWRSARPTRIIWLSDNDTSQSCRLIGVAISNGGFTDANTGQHDPQPLKIYDSVDIREYSREDFRLQNSGQIFWVGNMGWAIENFNRSRINEARLMHFWHLAFEECRRTR